MIKFALTAIGLALVSLLFLAPASRGQRPTAQPESRTDQLRRTLDAQSKQLKSAKETSDRYAKALKEKQDELAKKQKEVDESAKTLRMANTSWNTKRNPTCDTGLTFAKCQCRSGAARKKQMAALIGDIKDANRRAVARRRTAQTAVDSTAKTYRRFATEWGGLIRSFSDNLKEYKTLTTKEK